MSRSVAEVKAFFERVATDWDDMRLAYYDERVIDKMLEVAGPGEGAVAADIGTGTGFVAAGISPKVGQVLAVDNSKAMLAVAEKNLRELGISNVEFMEGDVYALPLEDGSVDATFSNMVLHHAERPAAMLAEMSRVVKPGGIVAIVDEVAHPYEWMHEEHADVWLGFERDQIEGFFEEAGISDFGYESLGMQ